MKLKMNLRRISNFGFVGKKVTNLNEASRIRGTNERKKEWEVRKPDRTTMRPGFLTT